MFRALLATIGLVGLLAGFHFWGEWQRAREWWWISGDRQGMTFLDLLNEKDGRGHVLSAVKDGAEEFDVEWKCSPQSVRWGEMWTRDEKFVQMERSPAPKDIANWHPPKGSLEKRIIEVACARPDQRLSIRSVVTKRPPIQVTHDAIEAVNAGADPNKALFDALGVAQPSRS